MILGVDQRLHSFDGTGDDGRNVDKFAAQFDFLLHHTGNIEQVVDEPHEMVNLPLDHDAGPMNISRFGRGRFQHLQGIDDGSQRIAQLVRQDRQKFILASVDVSQFGFDVFEVADIEHNSDPGIDFSRFTMDGNATGKDMVPLSVGSFEAVFAIPSRSRLYTLCPCGQCFVVFFGMDCIRPTKL